VDTGFPKDHARSKNRLAVLFKTSGLTSAKDVRLCSREMNMTIHPARTIAVSIDRDWREVYDFVSIPQNFPRWAAGLGLGARFEKSGDEWTAEDPDGRPIRIRFSAPNTFGVLDHVVLTADGVEILNPMRVVANGTGAEIMFTVLKLPDMTDQGFSADAAAVERDLNSLKALLEH
jgi:hypothetical protein